MKFTIVYRLLIFSALVLLPSVSFCGVVVGGYDFDYGFLLLAGSALIVIVGALMSIISLDAMLINLQKEQYGIETKTVHQEPFWERMKEKMSDIVPVENEKTILLEHDYDGIQELDNNLPPWWLYGFYFTIIFGIFYIGYYHYYDGGYGQIQEYEDNVAMAEIAVSKYLEKQSNSIDEANLEALTDIESIVQGQAIFTANCIACHMKGGGGSPISVGPNLTDAYWIHGGDITSVFKTIKYGVPEKGMIAWKAQLKPADMHRVASYILSLQGTNPPNAKEPQGELYVAAAEDTTK